MKLRQKCGEKLQKNFGARNVKKKYKKCTNYEHFYYLCTLIIKIKSNERRCI